MKLDPKDMATISKNYDIKFEKCTPIEAGEENTSFLLHSAENEFVLTIYEQKSFQHVEYLCLIMDHLRENNYYTNRLVSTADGKFLFEVEDKPAVLKRWIPGVTLRDSEQSDYRVLGQAIARLHQIPAPQFLPKAHPYGLEQMSGTLGLRIDLPYESWLSEKIDYLIRNLNTELPKTFIHGDLFDDNILYHQGRFKAIIDFEDA